jgi:hypothetical protein
MSTPGANPALTATTPPAEKKSSGFSIFGGFEFLFGVLFFFLVLLGPGLSAAKLSYDKYQSILWAILDFFFAVFYIPYYAFFLNTPTQQSTFGGRRRR